MRLGCAAALGSAFYTRTGRLFIGTPPATFSGTPLVYTAPPTVLKWTARARTGALATRARLFKNALSPSAQCPACAQGEEDDVHALTGCPATGSLDCASYANRLWGWVGAARGAALGSRPAGWVNDNLLMLSGGLIPTSMHGFVPSSLEWLTRSLLRTFTRGWWPFWLR